MYAAIINTPGYLSEQDELPTFDTASEAWSYLADERRRHEDDLAEDASPYSATVDELDAYAGADLPGVVYGATPGGRMYDLGIAYSVVPCESDE